MIGFVLCIYKDHSGSEGEKFNNLFIHTLQWRNNNSVENLITLDRAHPLGSAIHLLTTRIRELSDFLQKHVDFES